VDCRDKEKMWERLSDNRKRQIRKVERYTPPAPRSKGSERVRELGNERLEDAALQDAALQDAALQDATLQDAALQDAALQDAALQDAALQDASVTEQEIREWYGILEKLYRTKVKTPLWPVEFFLEANRQGVGMFRLVKLENKIIGGSFCVVLDKNKNTKNTGENNKNNISNQKSGDTACCWQQASSISTDSVPGSELPLQNQPLSSDSVSCDTESSPSEKDDWKSSRKMPKNPACGTVYEWFECGLNAEYKEQYPSVMATWAGMEWAHAHGCARYDMMGAGEPGVPYGVRDFKSEFGGEMVEHGRYLCVLKPWLYQLGTIGVRLQKKDYRKRQR